MVGENHLKQCAKKGFGPDREIKMAVSLRPRGQYLPIRNSRWANNIGLCFNLDIYRINRLCTAIIIDTVKLPLASKLLHALHCMHCVTSHDFVVHACMHVRVYCAILTYCARGPTSSPAILAVVYWPGFSHIFVNSFPIAVKSGTKKLIMINEEKFL